ncbi:hypothetical protein [Actinomadura coerulea]|uniref:hypothetical protein n=1 Tax=Actinomadura coerulea TaxID=46159 RepID=UPI00341AD965
MLVATDATGTIERPLVGVLVNEGTKRRTFMTLFTLPSDMEEATGKLPTLTETQKLGRPAEASNSAPRRPGGVGGRPVYRRAEF